MVQNMEKIKKNLLPVIIGTVFGFAAGVLLFSMDDGKRSDILLLEFFIAFFVGSIIQTILHELGHMIAGLISGYEFSSFRIFQFTWIRENGKVKFKKFSLKGTAGQCLMIPPKDRGLEYPIIFYNIGGVLMNFISSVLFLIFGFTLKNEVFVFMCIPGFYLALTNGIPLQINGIANDGKNIVDIRKSKTAKKAMDTLLRCNALQMHGIRLKDMPQEWFVAEEPCDLRNIHVCTLIYLDLCRESDKGNYVEYEKKVKEFLGKETALLEIYRCELKCELIFVYIKQRRYDEAEKLYMEMEQYLNRTKMFLEHYPLMYGYQKLVKQNQGNAEKLLTEYEKMKKTYPYKSAIVIGDEDIKNIDSGLYQSEKR